MEADDEKLLQVVLVGSPELETKLADPELRSIKQRVALWCRLAPLQSCEVAAYIDHRVMRAGQGAKIYLRRTRSNRLLALRGEFLD